MRARIFNAAICLLLFHAGTKAQTANKKSLTMKEFILIVRVPSTYTTEKAREVNPKWDIVLAKWKADNVFVTSFVFPGESQVITGKHRNTKKEIVVAVNLKIVSSIILRAENIDAAVELGKMCPILDYDGTVEIREIPPRNLKPSNQ